MWFLYTCLCSAFACDVTGRQPFLACFPVVEEANANGDAGEVRLRFAGYDCTTVYKAAEEVPIPTKHKPGVLMTQTRVKNNVCK